MSNIYADELRRAANGWGRDMGQARLLNGAAEEIDRADRLAEAARTVLRHEGADPEPCWRCGGSGSRCEDRLGELVDCRCCGGMGSHCTTVQSKNGTIACVDHHPKQREAECQSEPELYSALVGYENARSEDGPR